MMESCLSFLAPHVDIEVGDGGEEVNHTTVFGKEPCTLGQQPVVSWNRKKKLLIHEVGENIREEWLQGLIVHTCMKDIHAIVGADIMRISKTRIKQPHECSRDSSTGMEAN